MPAVAVIAKNVTAGPAVSVPIDNLSAIDRIIPANGQRELSVHNPLYQILNDEQLRSHIDNDLVLLNIDGVDLTKAQSQSFMVTATEYGVAEDMESEDHFAAGPETIDDTAWTDVPNSSFTFTTTNTGRIAVWANMVGTTSAAATGDPYELRLVVGAENGNVSGHQPYNDLERTVALQHRTAVLAAGTYTIKVQARRLSGSENLQLESISMIALSLVNRGPKGEKGDTGAAGAGIVVWADDANVTGDERKSGSAWADLLTLTRTPADASNRFEVVYTASSRGVTGTSSDREIDFQLLYGLTGAETAVKGTFIFSDNGDSDEAGSCALSHLQNAAGAGEHTFKIQWRVRSGGGTARIDPTDEIWEHATMIVKELT